MGFARAGDIGAVVNLLLDQHAEMGTFKASRTKIALMVERLVRQQSVIIARRMDNDRIVASIGLNLYSPYWTEQQVLGDMWIYIRPEERSLRLFGSLIREARIFAHAANLPLLISLFSLKDHDRKAKLFERHARRVLTVFGLTEMGGEFAVAP